MQICHLKLTIKPHFPNFIAANPEFFNDLEAHLHTTFAKMRFEDINDFKEWAKETLPLVRWEEDPHRLTVFIFCYDQTEVPLQEFLLPFLSKQMFKNKSIFPNVFQSAAFSFEEIAESRFFACEIQYFLDHVKFKAEIKHTKVHLQQEIVCGCLSPMLAKHVFQTERPADKTSILVYQKLLTITSKFPFHDLEASLPNTFTRLAVLSPHDFIKERSVQHLCRIVCSHSLAHKQLARLSRLLPEERHLSLRFIRARLGLPFGQKPVLGIAIGICTFTEYELFAEKHILMAVQQFIPCACLIEGSFYSDQPANQNIRLLYIEFGKSDGTLFSLQEVQLLKRVLVNALKARVERLASPLFMTRNEEEVMKAIFILSRELRYHDSLPQVMISFESQSATELVFTVVVLHLLGDQQNSLEQVVLTTDRCKWIPERIQVVDYIDRILPKQAAVFHVKMQKDTALLRADFSINFYEARQRLIAILQDTLGPIRDYNGGMIAAQSAQLAEFKRHFLKESTLYPDLLDTFFYSLTPIEKQATLSQHILHLFFPMCLEACAASLPKQENYYFKTQNDSNHTFVVIRMRDSRMKDSFLNTLEILRTNNYLISAAIPFQGSSILGYVFASSDACAHSEFTGAIKQAIAEGVAKLQSQRNFRLAVPNFPISLDPRIGGEMVSSMVIKMLFEGLMKYDSSGELTYGVAESHTLSLDEKRYIFRLRKSVWSDGQAVTAHDFAYAWKKILSPDFNTPYAYLFYPIKHAKQVKNGKLPLDRLGIQVCDEYTLLIDLEHPTPYFLELTALSLYSPVPHTLDQIHPHWAHSVGQKYVCNGPFSLLKRDRVIGIELVKNPLYWETQAKQPDRICITPCNAQTANQMYQNDEIDWLGSPLQPWSPNLFAHCHGQTESVLSSKTLWCACNTKNSLFRNKKLRQAFSYALDRKKMLEIFHYKGEPAFTPLPLKHKLSSQVALPDADEERARSLFEEALQELGISKNELPQLTIVHGLQDPFWDDIFHSLAEQWQRVFDITCRIENYKWAILFDKLLQGDFQLLFAFWGAWVDDPIYTLNSFKYVNEPINLTKWENSVFQQLLDNADQTLDRQERRNFLEKAEEILLQEVPVIPILHELQQFMRNEHIQVPLQKNTGMFHFRSVNFLKNSFHNKLL